MCSSRLRPSSMFTSTRPSSQRYQVAVDTGWPSRRRVVMTAGLGLRSMATAASGSGGFDMRASKLSCVDAYSWHRAPFGLPYASACPRPARKRYPEASSPAGRPKAAKTSGPWNTVLRLMPSGVTVKTCSVCISYRSPTRM